MNASQAIEKLSSIGQQKLLDNWNSLFPSQQSHLLQEIGKLDIALVATLQNLLSQKDSLREFSFEPFTDFYQSGNAADIARGKQLIAQGKCATLIVAGGQGTRLRQEGPKGLFPVSVIQHKSLFQLFAEKTWAAGKQLGIALPMALMTSPLNHSQTMDYFKQQDNFGLNSGQISFFRQGMLPFLNEEGNLFLEGKDQIAQGPDGNGTALYHFVQSGLWKEWHEKGIRYVNFVLIDNPLADPFDAELVGFHDRNECAVTVKSCVRRDPEENVGVLTQKSGRVHVIEYTEMPKAERYAQKADGTLKYSCANLSLFCFSMEQIARLAERINEMPLHIAHKKGWKFEKFIFDVLPMSSPVKALLYPREICFAPLKNFEGSDSLATVQAALQQEDRRLIESITGIKPPPEIPFELSQEFHYPTPELLNKWQGRQIQGGYIRHNV